MRADKSLQLQSFKTKSLIIPNLNAIKQHKNGWDERGRAQSMKIEASVFSQWALSVMEAAKWPKTWR